MFRRDYSGKNVRSQKSRGKLPWREFHGGSLVQGVIFHEGNYSRVIIWRDKVQRVIFLGGLL